MAERIEMKSKPTEGECVRWGGALTGKGYPALSWEGRSRAVHRLVCEEAYGPPPPGKPLCLHSCDHKWCIFAGHLRWGDWRDNYEDWRARQMPEAA